MYISVQDLAIFLVACIVIITGIYFLITLLNINNLLKDLRATFNHNEEAINSIAKNLTGTSKNLKEITDIIVENKEIIGEKLPQTIENAYAITTTLKNTAYNVDTSVEVINAHLVETATTVKENTQDIVTYMKILSEGLRVFIQVFTRSK